MRIALSQGTLRVPPTYFSLQHARVLRDRHAFAFFTLASEVTDPALTIPVHSVVTIPGSTFRQREVLIPAAIPLGAARIAAWRPDVIHQQFATWSAAAVTAAGLTRTPMVTTMHGWDVYVMERRWGGAMTRWHRANVRAAWATSSRVLAVSRFLADEALRLGAPGRKLDVLHMGVDTDVFTPGTRDDAAEPTVVYVGTLSSFKGVDTLARASVAAYPRAPHRLRLVGTGPLHDELTALSRQHPHIDVLGRRDQAGVVAEMRAARVGVLASIRDAAGVAEAAGLVLLEAQACGTPVIATASGGKPEMLVPDSTGLLVPDHDHARLADALVQVLRLPARDYQAMRARAREFAVTERSLTASAARLEATYHDLAG